MPKEQEPTIKIEVLERRLKELRRDFQQTIVGGAGEENDGWVGKALFCYWQLSACRSLAKGTIDGRSEDVARLLSPKLDSKRSDRRSNAKEVRKGLKEDENFLLKGLEKEEEDKAKEALKTLGKYLEKIVK